MLAPAERRTARDTFRRPEEGPEIADDRRPAERSARLALIASLVALSALAVACSEQPPSPARPTSAFRSTGAIATQTSGGLPTASPGAATGNLSSGRVAFRMSGDIRADKAIEQIISSAYAPPPGGMALVWTAGGTDATTVGLGGLSFTGSQPTSPSLTLTITVQTGGAIATFISSAGECSITIGVAETHELAGTFSCSDLRGGDGDVVDVTGTISAQG